VDSLPPLRTTTGVRRRLHVTCAVATVVAVSVGMASTASARTASVRVLVGTSVSAAARDSMSPALWARLVANYVSAQVVPFNGTPTLDDCHRAKAAYMLEAAFDLRPRLPGMVNSEGRVAARTRLIVTNCVTGHVAYDQVVFLDSDPPSTGDAGDFESVPEISWSKAVPQELARYPVFFPHVARIKSVSPPFAYIELAGTAPMKVGDVLTAFANANGERRAPVILTVTNTDAKLIQVLFSATGGDPVPEAGDYVEPMQSPPPSPAPTHQST
jgi:hypothetical protein